VLLGMLHELESTQWLPAAELARRQSRALDALLGHARATVPYYRDHPGYAPGRPWAELPILRRDQIQDAGVALLSTAIPTPHLPLTDLTTSGSTGPPLTVKGTQITGLFWLVCTLRDHRWHGRDPMAKVATLRPDQSGTIPPEGVLYPTWGSPIDAVYDTGPLGLMPLPQDITVQAEFLTAQDPHYLLSLPSNLLALCRHFARTGARLPRLREVRSFGEALSPEVRDACRQVWGVGVTDMYSSQELGYLALQCPTAERYHVMSELILVEVLDESGQPCPAGATGRVVATQLHNYAMPLLRYDLGDWAQVGPPCPCGRGLPVLDRVFGPAPTIDPAAVRVRVTA
jgi:phenylacetate-CoA ligase